MALITILIALVMQRFANLAGWFSPAWFEVYLSWFKPFLVRTNKWTAIGLVLLPVFAVLGILQLLLTWRLFGLFYLVLSAVVLMFCMDARNLKEQLAPYFASAEKQDADGAVNAVAKLTSDILPHSLPELNRAVTKFIFAQSFTHIFVVLFWFSIFGIYGAAGYTMLNLLRRFAIKVDGSFAEIATTAGWLQDLLDWLPVRALGLSYALVGHFARASAYFFSNLHLGIQHNLKFATDAGLAALDANLESPAGSLEENHQALTLIDHALIIWIVAVALVTLGMLL